MTKAFIPPYPPRPTKPVATWRGFFGERARTSVYGWSERAFEIGYLKRNILGFRVHILLDPDLIDTRKTVQEPAQARLAGGGVRECARGLVHDGHHVSLGSRRSALNSRARSLTRLGWCFDVIRPHDR